MGFFVCFLKCVSVYVRAGVCLSLCVPVVFVRREAPAVC